MASPIYVTQPFLPPLAELQPLLEEIWRSRRLTNGGPFHEELESSLCSYLGLKHVSLFGNGTLGLVTALQSLRITGEVITTPFSFVATAHALLWNGIRPVFVDIDPESLNLDPEKVEAAITPLTTAILPVHVYGRPCATTALQAIAERYGLKLIYDAAHAFAVEDEGGSVLRHGDLSVISFHATKVFTTFEGGAIISPDEKTKKRIDFLKNFGFADEVTVVAPGINAKMCELQAAVGLVQLRHIDAALSSREAVDETYRRCLAGVEGIRCLSRPHSRRHNFSYFPILVDREFPISRDRLYEDLRARGIFARRYFFPLITEFPMYRSLESADKSKLPVATRIAEQVICLPIYPGLTSEDVERVCNGIISAAHGRQASG